MASEILLPKQGNSVESCIIVEWKVDVGTPVSKGQPILEVETDKATMDVESTADGVLLAQLVAAGDDVPVMSPVAIVGEAGEKIDAGSAASQTATAGAAQAAVGATVGPGAVTRSSGVKISPRAKRLALERGVEYAGIGGSGPGGRIMVRDVEAALASGAGSRHTAAAESAEPARVTSIQGTTQAPIAESASAIEEITVKGVRKLIAERMHASIISTAQLTMDASADARALLAYRKRLKGSASPRLQSISINDLVLFATARALRESGELNATFADGVIRRYGGVDLGFAVDTPRGLMVPVIRGADRRSLGSLAEEAHRLAKGCLEGGINPDELSGATFTVTNLGVYGIERFTPVLNTPQVGILGVCAITNRPAPSGEGTIPMIGLSLTIDHQVVDGAPGARFLQAVSRSIAEIDLTLAE